MSNKPLLSRSSSSSSVGSSQGNINSTNFNTNLSINQSSSFAQESPQTCSGKFIHFLKYCGRHSPMTTEQKLRLDWWTKWRKYGRFPWKFLFDVLMTIFATVLVFLHNEKVPYVVSNVATFFNILYPPGFNTNNYGFGITSNTYYLYTINDCLNLINNSINAYYELPETSVDYYYFDPDPKIPSPVSLTVVSYADKNIVFDTFKKNVDTSLQTENFKLTPYDLGPLAGNFSSLQTFFRTLYTMNLEFSLRNGHLLYGFPVTHVWRIDMNFDFSARGGRIIVNLDVAKEKIVGSVSVGDLLKLQTVIIGFFLIFICMSSSIAGLRAIKISFDLYLATKKKLHGQKILPNIQWSDLPISVKIRFFNVWFLISITASLCNVISCFFDIFSPYGPEEATEKIVKIFLGLGCLLSWINLMRYLEIDSKYMILIHALGNGMPNVGRFIVGAFFIFMGYALFGLLYFSADTERFGTLDEALLTLFSLQNGDDIQATFRSTDNDIWVSRIYFYTFLFLAIYVVANIFIAIIEEAYFGVKEGTSKNSKKDDPKSTNDNDSLWTSILQLHNQQTVQLPATPTSTPDNSESEEEDHPTSKRTIKEKEIIQAMYKEISSVIKEQQKQFKKELESSIDDIISTKLGIKLNVKQKTGEKPILSSKPFSSILPQKKKKQKGNSNDVDLSPSSNP